MRLHAKPAPVKTKMTERNIYIPPLSHDFLIYTPVFVAELFIIATIQKQPLVDE